MQKSLLILMMLIFAVGCSTAKKVNNISELEPHQRVVFGEVIVKGEGISSWVTGIYSGAALMIDDKIMYPQNVKGKAVMNANSTLTKVDCDFDEKGCVFNVAYNKGEFYIHGIRAASTNVLLTFHYNMAMWSKIKKSNNQCEYIGTFIVTKVNNNLLTEVKDDYKNFKRHSKTMVKGCNLKKNIATRLNDSEVFALAEKFKAAKSKKKK